MNQLVFATGNPHKIQEVNEILRDRFHILSLKDIGCYEELPETSPTIEGNALEKARFVHQHFGKDCFAEDAGLEVRALGGEPGVFSARYAGAGKNAEDNTLKVLQKMDGVADRRAQFRTVIALILNGKEYIFEGIAPGTIRQKPSGTGGFGYDPVFQPGGFEVTFAEMPAFQKNKISHRGKAVQLLIEFLAGLSG